ncbi:MAG: serine/threonine protein kinase [Proteobacteria bacterium]|nr:serine/threonine protein kinase [Pseudomonadota bacterium]
MSDARGKTLGNFTVEDEIGRGGMGVVYLARQRQLERPAVLKKLRRDLGSDTEFVQRFEREAQAAAAVHHQNVVAVYDCFSYRGDHYIAQEYVDGLDLRSVLATAGRLPSRIAALLILEAARGLEEIHRSGTVHRDLKPGNLLIGRSGEVKIADFGIALDPSGPALTTPGMMIGSPPYMPPEQMLGERVDGRGDVFSLGAVLYETLTGVPPYAESDEASAESLLARKQHERYVRPRQHARDIPRALARLIRTCLRPRPKARPGTATLVRRRLEAFLGHPSSADARATIAEWMWENGVFVHRGGETVVLSAHTPERGGRRWLRWWAPALALAAVLGSLLVIEIRPEMELPPWAEKLAELAPLDAAAPGPEASEELSPPRRSDAP